MTQDTAAATTNPLLNGAITKAFRRIIPLIIAMFVLNYIDRVNVGFAKESLEADAGIGSAAYGLGAGLFFVTYAIFEIPSNLLMERFGARLWLTRIMISWGVISAAMMFVNGPALYYTLRLLLGVAEAGFFAGVIFYFVQWFPDGHRGRANSYLYVGSAIGAIIGGPASGSLLEMHGFLGLAGWQWMFLVEGAASIVVGIIVWNLLPSRPADARWLAPAEKDALTAMLEREQRERRASAGPAKPPSRLKMLADPQMSLLCFVYFVAQLAQYAVTFWLPTIIDTIGGLSDAQVGWLSAVPWIFAGIAILAAGRISDRTGLRRTVVAVGFVLAAVGTAFGAFVTPVLALVFLCVASMGFKIAASAFYVIPQRYLDGRLAAPGIALINSIGNLGGFVAPTTLGFVESSTGSATAGLYVIAAISAIGAGAVAFTRIHQREGKPHAL